MYLNCSIFLNQHLFFIFHFNVNLSMYSTLEYFSLFSVMYKSNLLLYMFLVKWIVLVIWHIILYMHLHELVCSSPLSK